MKKILLFTITLLFIGGCGSTKKKNNNINIVNYIPASDIIKRFFTTKDNGNTHLYEESITIYGNNITVEKNNLLVRTLTINDSTILEDDIENNITKTLKKYISIGNIIYTLPKSKKIEDIKLENIILGTKQIESIKTCKLENKLTKLEDYDIKYYDDILKFKCIEEKKIVTKVKDNLPDYINIKNGEEKSDYDVSYFYMKKDIGLIVEINDDCIVKEKELTRINDLSKKCNEKHYSHTFFLE